MLDTLIKLQTLDILVLSIKNQNVLVICNLRDRSVQQFKT